MNQSELLDALVTLLPSQFEEILFRLRIPPQCLSTATPQMTRAVEAIRFLEMRGRLEELRSLLEERIGRRSTKEEQLTQLLVKLFSSAELRRFVRFGPDGANLASSLTSEPASLLDLASQVVDTYRRHGMIDTSLFDRLVDSRPLRAEEIHNVERRWIQEPGQSGSLETAVRTHESQRPIATPDGRRPARVFISYSHRDRSFVEDLAAHIQVLQRQGIVEAWSDSEITAGANWRERVVQELERAEVILLMVSSNYLASDFCWSVELQHALKRHQEGSAVVVPVLLRPCDWRETPFSSLEALPKDNKPVSAHMSTDKAWVEIASEIRRVVMANTKSESGRRS